MEYGARRIRCTPDREARSSHQISRAKFEVCMSAMNGPHSARRRPSPTLFESFFMGGFECSSLRRADGRQLDLIAATRHDASAATDYQVLADHGIRAVR